MLNFGKGTKTVTKKKTLFRFTGYILNHEGILCVTTVVIRLYIYIYIYI